MLDGIKRLYSGESILSKHITLFSICGIVGLFNALVSFDKTGIADISVFQKCFFQILWVIFAFFLTGYETLFLHERFIPEPDIRSFKLMFSKTLMFVFVVSISLSFIVLFFPKFAGVVFFLEVCLSVPLTILQAGFSYNFNDYDVIKIFDKFCIKDYFILVFKRLLVVACAYMLTFALIFVLFFILGLILSFIYRSDLGTLAMLISSQQIIIAKLSNLLAGILIMYFITVGTLAWDYEFIKRSDFEG